MPGAARIWGTNIFTKWEQRPLLNIKPRDMPEGAAHVKNTALNFMRGLVLVTTHALAFAYLPTVTLNKAVAAYFIYMIPGLFGIT